MSKKLRLIIALVVFFMGLACDADTSPVEPMPDPGKWSLQRGEIR